MSEIEILSLGGNYWWYIAAIIALFAVPLFVAVELFWTETDRG